MPAHKIVMGVPDIELDGRDVEFVVKIDGHKRGTLRVSQGTLDWQTSRKRNEVVSVPWSELIDWLEGAPE